MFEFFKHKDGSPPSIVSQRDRYGTSGYAMYKGQALTVSSNRLIRCNTGDFVYAISNVSAASSVITASYQPEVFLVNENQVWRGAVGSALSASVIADAQLFSLGGKKVNLYTSAGTSIDGGTSGSVAFIYDLVTASTPSTSAVYVIFISPPYAT